MDMQLVQHCRHRQARRVVARIPLAARMRRRQTSLVGLKARRGNRTAIAALHCSKGSTGMEMHGEVGIAAPRDRVWAALNDPETLARCIDGVESLTRIADPAGGDRFEGRMNARVGPVRASFAGHVTLTKVDAPNSYVLVGEGKGGVAGFAKGEAAVTLTENGADSTTLTYAVTSSVGGKLAQLGARLIEGAAKGYADSFFAKLKAEIEVPAVAPAPDIAAPALQPVPLTTTVTGISPLVWGSGLVAAVLAFLVWQWG
jgi:carbon monoxide dehydrogenase subunit G